MTSTKETPATQYALNAPDCPFIGHCSCCERHDYREWEHDLTVSLVQVVGYDANNDERRTGD